MFKDRLFLNGLGGGIIIGALLMQLMSITVSGDTNQVKTQLSSVDSADQQIAFYKTELKKRGYQITDRSDALYTKAQLDSALQKQKNELAQVKPTPVTNNVWGLAIPNGFSSSELADMLLQMKLIDDKEKFESELDAKGLATKIKAKVYIFTRKPSLSELIDTITS